MEIDDFKGKLNIAENNINTLNDTIKNLKESITLKDDQLNTIKGSISLKDDQIKTLDSSLKLKDEKIASLEKTLEAKSTEASSVNAELMAEKDKKIEELQKEIELLNDELSKADEDLETLELENEKMKKAFSESAVTKIPDFTDVDIKKSEILEKMHEILKNALHSVIIAVPNISDLQDLYLYELRSSVNLKISCGINPGLSEHAELLDEYESLDNMAIRNFEGSDRYVLIKDGDELLFAVIGKNEFNHLVIHTRDSAHIRLLNSLVMEAWLRSRKLNS